MQKLRLFVLVFGFGLLGNAALQAQNTDGTDSCVEPRFLLHMSNAENGITGAESPLLNGTPLRTYEGEPYEWSHYAVTPLACDSDEAPAFRSGGNTVAGIFIGSGPDATPADLVPENCNDPVYLLGVNTVTDQEQYRIYATALSNSKIAQRHGFVRLFGRTPNPLLAGEWPDNTSATLSIWPCAEAFNTMYFSDWYRNDILPLRKDSARYRLMTFTPVNLP